MYTYMSSVQTVMRIALNVRLLQVLNRLHWCGAVLLPGTIAARVTFTILDNGYEGQHGKALRAIVGIESLLNTLSAGLGLWVFVWRPVQAAAIYPLRRTQWNASTAGPTTETSSPLPVAASPTLVADRHDSFMELKVKSLVETSLDSLPEPLDLGFGQKPDSPEESTPASVTTKARRRSTGGTEKKKKKKKKHTEGSAGEEGARRKKDVDGAANVTKRSKRRRRKKGEEEEEEVKESQQQEQAKVGEEDGLLEQAEQKEGVVMDEEENKI
eukprot:TRINITY_DN5252_c0_g1_i3.p2 TRINITY_DN5252_c0_g1~~TRINITY_DN5252_c0_g1_i3.p2  ORF type:complete len:270 (+),score=89.21 TRINITY_DN5252_c0_g1_i3:817-1626(+)